MRNLLALVIGLAAAAAHAGEAIVHYAAPGGTYAAHVTNEADTATVNFAFVAGRKYVILEEDLDGGVLAAGAFTGEVFAEAAAGVDLATDSPVALIGRTYWDGTTITEGAVDLSPITSKLPAGGRLIAAAGDIATNLDQITVGQSQPRVNLLPDPAFTRIVPIGFGGLSRVALPIIVPAGPVGGQTVALDMRQLYGAANFVKTVGAPVVTGSATVTATALGPRDWYAMLEIDGTIAAGEEAVISVPVEMVSGATRVVTFVAKGVQ